MTRKEYTKSVALTFLRSELLNDIAQYGYVEGDVQRADMEHTRHGKHQTQDIVEDGNIELVTRHLDLALSRCREALYPYSKRASGSGVALDDVLDRPDEYVIELTVPDDFSDSTAQYLEQLIHNLLVYYALWGWLSVTKPEGADKWLSMASALEEELSRVKLRRGVFVRASHPW